MTTPEETQEPQALDLSAGLSAYRPISRANSLEVSLPGSMAYQTRQALLRIGRTYEAYCSVNARL